MLLLSESTNITQWLIPLEVLHVQGVEERWGNGSRPIVLALSNPSEVAECTAQQAYDWSGGKAVYASGTAFPPFHTRDGVNVPAQANNSLIFPGQLCMYSNLPAKHRTACTEC